jgi:hypothetical protein
MLSPRRVGRCNCLFPRPRMVQELHNPVYIALPPRLIELRREFDTEVPYVRLGTPASLMPGSEKYAAAWPGPSSTNSAGQSSPAMTGCCGA